MVQKTYHLTDDVDSRMRDMIMEIKGQDGYLDKSCLLIIFAQCWDTDVIAKRKKHGVTGWLTTTGNIVI